MYYKGNADTLKSGIINIDISDHFPVMLCVNNIPSTKREPLTFIHWKLDDTNINNIVANFCDNTWEDLLEGNTDEAFNGFTTKLNDCIEVHAPLRQVTIPAKHIRRNQWMTKGLMNSLKTKTITNYTSNPFVKQNTIQHLKNIC